MLEVNKIYCGDCLEIMPQIDDKKIDMILCDMPYGRTACRWDRVISLDKLWKQYKRIIKDSGAIILTASQPFTTDLINSNRQWFKYELVWNKKIAGNVGLANKMPLKIHENILVFYKKQSTYNPQFHNNYTEMIGKFTETNSESINLSSKIKKLSGQRGFPRTILEYMRPNNMTGGGLHPTQKPVALFEYLIKTYTNEDELVLDNCIGSGTTAVACLNTNRNFIGMDIEQKCVDIANKRLANTYYQTELIR